MRKIFNLKCFQKGATLVELILYMSLLSVLLAVLTSIFASALDVQSESESTSVVSRNGNYVLARLAYDIHRAERINIPTENGLSNNSFVIVINGVNYTYSVDANDNLLLTNNSGINSLNDYGSKIIGFSAQRLGNVGGVEDALKINFTVASENGRISGFETKNFETNLSLRRQ